VVPLVLVPLELPLDWPDQSQAQRDAQFARVQRGGARDVLARKEVWQYFLSARGTYCDVANCDGAQDLVGRGQARSAGVDYEI